MLEAWLKAAGDFARALNERAERGETLESSREVTALWVETANEVLLEAQRSDAFLKTQRDLLRASTDLRLAQQELAEFYSEMFGYPTRLWARGPLHHGGPAGGPLARPQPPQPRGRSVCRRLGQPVPGRPLADAGRLHQWLSWRMRRGHSRAPRD